MLVIGIAGGTGSGKSSVARSIITKLGADNVTLICQDNYYLDHSEFSFEEREKINYDHPSAFENDLLLQHLKQLRQGKAVQIPVYDFTKHARSSETIHINVKPIVLVEGIHVLTDDHLREELNIKVFVDTDPDVRILRRIVRDMKERGRSLESVHDQYLNTVKPMHDAFIEPSKKYADIIIPEGGENKIGISMLTSLTERYLNNFVPTS
ncbi:uridine kinase Udk [Paenibacillus larvae subsp. larvae]|uniref:Uridine kinase n=1 Tax=Paenibacillus larvae subsp. larvae TaxID=147375 RepID=A0A2L1UDE1_9BACL|nr:uridine kinase [Paenibacillus larvae]AQT86541.1 uridine kinase [Paenibacillus larvae subsp. pulvifaciens]AQZ48206.1 uridine kinase [Paenibacillus larvae subsp. pulvifaciens]AVF26176.1 uridine kinase Udk [Paenibacillus larvae subsp. larvae]AVF30953.1 uridine kinase Udk [Paenibacillus larvae subsp. larvae]MBH0341550.1 uridine kinase [Paenibacillus larvae]